MDYHVLWNTIKYLLKNNIIKDVNAKYDDNYTLLMYAVEIGDVDIVKYLISHGADINAINDDNTNAIMLSCIHNVDTNIIDLLVNAGGDVNEKNTKFGITPLMYAVGNNNIEIVKYLLEHGANVNAKDNAGYTVINLAYSKKLKAYLEFYKKH